MAKTFKFPCFLRYLENLSQIFSSLKPLHFGPKWVQIIYFTCIWNNFRKINENFLSSKLHYMAQKWAKTFKFPYILRYLSNLSQIFFKLETCIWDICKKINENFESSKSIYMVQKLAKTFKFPCILRYLENLSRIFSSLKPLHFGPKWVQIIYFTCFCDIFWKINENFLSLKSHYMVQKKAFGPK